MADKRKIEVVLADKMMKSDEKWPINQEVADKLVSVLLFAMESGTITSGSVMESLSLSETTTKRHLRRLVKLGFLEPKGANKNRTYSASDELQKLLTEKK